MFFRLSFLTLLLALLALGTPVKRDEAQVEADIQTLTEKSQTLDVSIKALPDSGATLKEAWNIHVAATQLVSAINAAANDAEASNAFTEPQGASIIKQLQTLAPIVKEASSDIISKKTAIESTGAGLIAKQDLESMKTAIDSFAESLLTKTPADQQSTSEEILSEVNGWLVAAIDAY